MNSQLRENTERLCNKISIAETKNCGHTSEG